MAKGYDKGRSLRGPGEGYFDDPATRNVKRLGEIVSDLYMSTDERDIKRLWTSAHRALLKTEADKERIATVIAQRRVGALAKLVSDLTMAGKSSTLASGRLQSNSAGEPSSSSDGPEAHSGSQTSSALAPGAPASAAPVAATPSADELKSALKAFRKRLKLTRLNDESKLGRSPMSGGKRSNVVAIMAPREYRPAVWNELVRQGKLRDTGSGFYELIDGMATP